MELKELQRHAWDTGSMEILALLTRTINRLERLEMIAEAAAAVYEDKDDEHAWELLFGALSDAGMFDPPNYVTKEELQAADARADELKALLGG